MIKVKNLVKKIEVDSKEKTILNGIDLSIEKVEKWIKGLNL